MSSESAHRAVEAVWRIESARLIAALARRVGDIGVAEDLAQDALLAALERWPESGIPDNPGAWLMAAAKHRAIDHFRRDRRIEEKHAQIGHALMDAEREAPDFDTPLDDEIGDDLLRLIFTACHPVLTTEARVALTLRLLGGLTTEEIARAFLVPTSTIAQRIVRAKRTLADARVPFEVPRGTELEERLASVLEVVYLVFNEGYSATAGEDWVRPALCEDALRLGAKEVVVSRNASEMQKHAGSFDFILDTVSATHDYNLYLKLLRRDRTMVLVGAPDPTPLAAFALIPQRKAIAGSMIGGIRETQEMLDFCAAHGVASDVEVIQIADINAAYERMLRSDVRYRFVIDLASLT